MTDEMFPGVVVTRYKSSHGAVSKRLTLESDKVVSSPTCQIWAGKAHREALADWRDFAKLIDATQLDEAWSLGAMRVDRDDVCDIKTKSPQSNLMIRLFPDVITRTRDVIDYAPGAPAFVLLDFDAGDMTAANRQLLDEMGSFFGAMRALLPGFDEAAYIWRPSTSANLFKVGGDTPLKETQNLHCYLLVQDGADAERFLKTLLDRAWLLGLGWIKVSKDGKALERGIIDSCVWGGERLCFEGGPDLGPGLEQRDRHARIHEGQPYNTRRLLDLTSEEQSEVLRLKNAAKSDLGLKTRMEKTAKKFKAEKIVELVKRGVSEERAERTVEALCGGVRKLSPDFPLELDDGRIITVADILRKPQEYVGATMVDPIEGSERGRNVAFVMEQGNAIWSFAHGETLYFFAHDFGALKAAIEEAPEHEAANTLAKLLGDAAITEAEKAALIKLARQRDGIGVADVRNIIKKTERKNKQSADEKARAESGKPQIHLLPGAIVDVVVAADKALVAAKRTVKIFRRDRDLVRPSEIEMPASDKRKTTTIGFKMFKAHDLSVAMAVAADFYRPNQDGDLVRCDPPLSLAQKMMELTDKSHLPIIAGVISCPTLRPDGSVLSALGYDVATGMYHFVDQSIDISSMKDEPDRDDALAALTTLKELLVEFPFVNPVDQTVAISANITAACRAMFATVPGHGYTAPEAGSGKSFLSDVSSLIVSGKDCPVLAACRNEHEFEKQLSTALLSGCSLLNIDNRTEPLTGGLLCQAITQPLITLRPFGQNEREVAVVNRITVQVNGNNLTVSGDMTRRLIVGKLNAKMERPELREFTRNPRSMILADRGRYVAACLTIVRAYLLAGLPGKLPPLASFEAWSDTVRSALVWLGEPDVVSTLDAARATDPELEKLRAFMAAVSSCYGDGPDNAVALRRMCQDALSGSYASGDPQFGMLAEALIAICRTSGADRFDALRLGNWLRTRKDKIVDDRRLANVEDRHSKIVSWYVESLAPTKL